MDIVRFGLIGYGRVAHLHAQAIKDSLGATLVSVCGRNAAHRQVFADHWNIASRATVEEMVALDHIDAVIVATPHPQHRDDTLAAFASGCHVLVEKPMAVTVQECTDMILAAERSGKVLSVISQQRWFPANMRMREAVESGKLGAPALAQATLLGWREQQYYDSAPWRGTWEKEGGGVTINQAPHLLDLMHWFMGPVERIFGEWDNINHPGIEVEDVAIATVRFSRGGMGSILVSNAQKPGIYAQVHIHGSSGASVGVKNSASSIVTGGSVAASPTNDIWTIPGEEVLLSTFREQDEAFFRTIDPNTHFFSRQIDDFSRAIIDGCRPLVSGEDGRETVRMIEAIYHSGRSHEPVIYS
jgi:predicted dehydrogenase